MVKSCQILGLLLLPLAFLIARSLVNELKGGKIKPIPESLSRSQLLCFVLLIFVFGVLPRFLLLFIITANDEGFYMHEAWRLYTGQRLYYEISLTHPPASPLLTSSMFKLFGVGLIQAKAFPVVLSLLSIPLVFLTSRRFWGGKAALLSTLLFSMSPLIIYYTGSLDMYSELVFFSLLSAYLFLTGFEDSDRKKLFFSGLIAGVAVLFRLFGLFLVGTELVFLILRRREAVTASLTAYCAGILLALTPLVYYLHAVSPGNIFYFLVGFHAIKYPLVGFPEKIAAWAKNIAYYPTLIFYFCALATQKTSKVARRAHPDADLFFILWGSGIFILPFLPTHLDFLLNVYALYFIPPFAFLAGGLVETLNVSHLRTLFICIMLIYPAVTYSIYLDGAYYSKIKEVARFISANTEPSDTITGSYVLTNAVSFLTGRGLTEDVLGLTAADVVRSADGRCYLFPHSSCAEKAPMIIKNSSYVLLYPGVYSLFAINETMLENEKCIKAKEIEDITIYRC